MGESESRDSFREHRMKIMSDLERLFDVTVKLGEDLMEVREMVLTMKIKMAIWCALASSVPVILGLIVQFILVYSKLKGGN